MSEVKHIKTKVEGKGSEDLMRTDELLIQIDEQRNQLYLLAQSRMLADPEVVQMSQNLDQLLNLYNSLMN